MCIHSCRLFGHDVLCNASTDSACAPCDASTVTWSLTHPVLRAVGVELQCVEARRRAGNLSFNFSTQQTVKHGRTVTNSQDLHKEDVNVSVSVTQ